MTLDEFTKRACIDVSITNMFCRRSHMFFYYFYKNASTNIFILFTERTLQL